MPSVTRTIELNGHLMDSLTLSKVLDTIEKLGGDFELQSIDIGHSRKDFSQAQIDVIAPDNDTLEAIIEAVQPQMTKNPASSTAGNAGILKQPSRVKKQTPVSDGKTPKILMCPPDFFTVEYAINPWMEGPDGPKNCDIDEAKRQWEELYNTLNSDTVGAEVLLMKPAEGLPDLVFTANAAFVYGSQAIIANFKHPERQGETPCYAEWFEENGFDVTLLPDGVKFEGAGDALIWQDRVFAGYKTRTDIASHNWITAKTGLPVLSMELINEKFYHIDVCMCPLETGELIYAPNAFDDYGISVIEANVPKENRIPVTIEEANKFACNAVNVGNTVVFNQGSDRLADELTSRGLNVIQLNLSEFIKSGGSSKCLTLRVG